MQAMRPVAFSEYMGKKLLHLGKRSGEGRWEGGSEGGRWEGGERGGVHLCYVLSSAARLSVFVFVFLTSVWGCFRMLMLFCLLIFHYHLHVRV